MATTLVASLDRFGSTLSLSPAIKNQQATPEEERSRESGKKFVILALFTDGMETISMLEPKALLLRGRPSS
jgi:hypothetical protein